MLKPQMQREDWKVPRHYMCVPYGIESFYDANCKFLKFCNIDSDWGPKY